MANFLADVAKHIVEKHIDHLGDIAIVTPNRRAWLFLRKRLAEHIGLPTWSPLFISIEDFAQRLTGLQVPDALDLLFEFYDVYKKLEGADAGNLDAFIRWGKVLLADFDEIESSVENPHDLFAYFTQLEYINSWSPDGQTTEFQQRHLLFVSKFGNWHQAFRAHLLQKNKALKGMSIRQAALKVQNEAEFQNFKTVLFVGFNAFTRAEEQLISALQKQGKAEIIFDSDPYYEHNENHEAGFFIRKYRSKWNLQPIADHSSHFGTKKNIQIMGVARSVLQAQTAGHIISENLNISRNTDTAIVLTDESLLLPVLSALPLNNSEVNVTMGYPLKQTGVASLCEILFKFFDTKSIRKATHQGAQHEYYSKDLTNLILHPLSKRLLCTPDGKTFSVEVAKRITHTRRVFLSVNDFLHSQEEYDVFVQTFPVFGIIDELTTERFLEAYKSFCSNLQKKLGIDMLKNAPKDSGTEDSTLEWEAAKTVEALIGRIEQFIHPYLSDISIDTFKTIVMHGLEQSRLTFSGEPVKGLQVMGMLETRGLDFKNLIMLSTNEKVIPGSKDSDSLIPFSVKKKFKMYLHYEREAIYAYHFYRLLQRAENIYLLYNNDNEGLGGGEKSRYVVQLEYELPKYQPETSIANTTVAVFPKIRQAAISINVEKNHFVLERLQQLTASGFSPSSLATYIKCPLKFYFEKIERLKAFEDTEETLQSNTIGTALHKSLQLLYEPFKNQILSLNALSQMLANFEEICEQQLIESLNGGDITKGKNLIMANLTKHRLKTLLQNEQKKLQSTPEPPITLLETELLLQTELTIEGQDASISVTLKGTADRIDKEGDQVRIIDYKSGNITWSTLTVKNLEDLTGNPKYEQAFQLMMYNWMYCKENQCKDVPQSAIFSLNEPARWFIPLKLPTTAPEDNAELLERFQELLTALLTKILDPAQPFSQTDDLDHCRFCNFSNVCSRFPAKR